MLRSTFAGFRTASSALRVSQQLLDVTGQNMANINTAVYTRQRLDISSVSIRTNNLKYGVNGTVIGQGAQSTGVSQYRDSFLDLRYRNESAKVGSEAVKNGALSDIETVFDEISMDGLDNQFSDLVAQLQSLTGSPTDPVIEGVVRTSASMLCQMLNDYSNDVQTVSDQQKSYLEEGAIVDVNKLMKNIAEINKQIKEDNISGNPALELNDQRNAYIDELSSYLDIEVNTTQMPVGSGRTIDELSIKLKGNNMKLVDDDEYATIGVVDVTGTKDISIKLTKSIDSTLPDGSDLTASIDKGQIAGYIEFLNGKGEFNSANTADAKGVQYYEKRLDVLANKFAELMNEENRPVKLDTDGKPVVDVDGNTVYTDKPLFEARKNDDGTTPPIITAGNIKISSDWSKSTESYITNTKTATGTDTSAATDNILNMISLFKSKTDFTTKNFTTDDASVGTKLFTGSLQEYFSSIATDLNLRVEDTQNSYDTYSETQYQINESRNALSSVDESEEGINMLTYSKSFNAAAKLMTTLDEMLDTLINMV